MELPGRRNRCHQFRVISSWTVESTQSTKSLTLLCTSFLLGAIYHFMSHLITVWGTAVKLQNCLTDNDEPWKDYPMAINIHKIYKDEYRNWKFQSWQANMLVFSPFVFISTLLAVAQAVALEERAAAKSKYIHDHSSGSASFTVYSGCGSALIWGDPVTELLFFDNSLWHNSLWHSGVWVYSNNKPTCLYCLFILLF